MRHELVTICPLRRRANCLGEILMSETIETENDLLALWEQPESARLEFKSSALLAKSKDEIIADLSKEISAFANSEGGQIVIGLREKKEGKTRVADDIDDGTESSQISMEWLQQIAQSNVSPYLPGLRVRRIALSAPRHGRVAFVISVPPGSTAYQAGDRRYYGRSEYQVQALPDHEIRLRMMKGRLARAELAVAESHLLTAEQEFVKRRARVAEIESARKEGRLVTYGRGIPRKDEIEAPKRAFDALSIRTDILNVGEMTIRDFLLVLRCEEPLLLGTSTRASLVQRGAADQQDRELCFRFAYMNVETRREAKVFPGDRVRFPDEWVVRAPTGSLDGGSDLRLRWAVYLDDAPPSSGEIQLKDCIEPLLERQCGGRT